MLMVGSDEGSIMFVAYVAERAFVCTSCCRVEFRLLFGFRSRGFKVAGNEVRSLHCVESAYSDFDDCLDDGLCNL